jgi:hypothetical protein
MSNDRINELPICAKLLYRPQIICDGRVVAESDCVNPDGPEAAALLKGLVEALEVARGEIARVHQARSALPQIDAALSKARAQ